MLKAQYGRDPLPNILLQKFRKSSIYELDGVQFAMLQSHKEIIAGQRFEILAVVQNCWDTERTFMLKLKNETRISLNRAGLMFPQEPAVTLPSASVATLKIPVNSDSKAKGKYCILASPNVTGKGGTRIRRWRAKGISSQSPWLTYFGAFAGVLVFGGGIKFPIKVLKNKHPDIENVETLDFSTEIIWEPPSQNFNKSAVFF